MEESDPGVRCHLIMDVGKVNVRLISDGSNPLKTEWMALLKGKARCLKK